MIVTDNQTDDAHYTFNLLSKRTHTQNGKIITQG